MDHRITIKEEDGKESVTLHTTHSIREILDRIQDEDTLRRKGSTENACIWRNKQGDRFLCIQEGAGSAWYRISNTALVRAEIEAIGTEDPRGITAEFTIEARK